MNKVWYIAITTWYKLLSQISNSDAVRIKQEEMKSSDFHITSDLLEEEGASYDVTDWRSGIDILLYNYEKEDLLL